MIAIVLIMIIAVLSPFILWQLKDDRVLDVVVLDNTVPNDTYREHHGLLWTMNYLKYVDSEGENYDSDADYYGFFPLPDHQYEIRELPDPIGEDTDLIYIADAYGVYTKEFYGENPLGERSEIIYGGMYSDEMTKVEEKVRGGTPLVVEFNTFGSPTAYGVKERLYGLLEVEWTGWIGRYFFELSEGVEVPIWAVYNYEAQYGVEWEFSGPGFVVVDEMDHVIVLEQDIDIMEDGCMFEFTEQGKDMFGINDGVRYNYWFNIVTTRANAQLLATFQLDLTESGIAKLEAWGIPFEFPAVVKNETPTYFSYYLSGDFVDIETIPGFYKIWGYDTIKRQITSKNDQNENDGFFWHIYFPMVKHILGEVYEFSNT
ncbi:MAG: hypothetical protein JW825_06505 [Candidatus Methanofastidiosa archaeon]|nr:hypothetical protein [Candidatus Methanofastidiosa archaeon]